MRFDAGLFFASADALEDRLRELAQDADTRYDVVVISFEGIDFIDLYDRNPTSGDREVDVDEVWLRFGREVEPAREADGFGAYAKIGKFGHFERQDDRHLESYGLVSTAFNRFEDAGLEVGFDFGLQGCGARVGFTAPAATGQADRCEQPGEQPAGGGARPEGLGIRWAHETLAGFGAVSG